MDYKKINFPETFEYSSDDNPIPLEFYLDVLPCSKEIFLKLGYFSSKAIQVLAYGFAQFIFNGGVIKIITNHFLYENDIELLGVENGEFEKSLFNDALSQDLKWLYESLHGANQHFVDCLKFLVKSERLEIIPVLLKPNRMAHFKEGVFLDGSGNSLYFEGSCNFTANGLLENGESISIYRSWGSEFEKNKVDRKRISLKELVDKKSDKYEYLEKHQILNAVDSIGREKNIKELLYEELNLLQKSDYKKQIKKVLAQHEKQLSERIQIIESTPKFPFNSSPREYQIEAYEKWKNSNKQGIFAMATGTGKTITALNCLLNEYLETGVYQAIILVPSKVLLNQWSEEVLGFNFQNVHLVSSENSQWRQKLNLLDTSLIFEKKKSFIVIVTYSTFPSNDFQNRIKNFPKETVLVADEAHNMGAGRMKALLPSIQFSKRIALSATPNRNYDPEGNEVLEEFFNSREPYTYSFSMEKAIRDGVLCEYEYFPHLVFLNDEEMCEYIEISRKLARFFDPNTGGFVNSEQVKIMLLQRKRIIHKAENKLHTFKGILNKRVNSDVGLKFSFVYVPEGENSQGENMLESYMSLLDENHSSIRAFPYTSKSFNNKEVMDNFEKGYIDMLFSMKCLDEGVDIPRAELAIFCSSTGNPRQFIQRRGRVLRKHRDKKSATIHDLVVVPRYIPDEKSFLLERNLIKNELTRVIYFASLSTNYYEAMEVCANVAEQYDLDIYALDYELRGES